MIGEAYLPIDQLMAYYGADLTGFHLPFNFHLISTDWEPKPVAELIDAYEAALPVGAWPNWVLGNHDRSRVASRVGRAQARVAAMLLLTLRGTPTIYQGEEIGMVDTPIPPHLVQDPWSATSPGSTSGAILCARPCLGAPNHTAVLLTGNLGFHSTRTPTCKTSQPRPTIRDRCCRSIGRLSVSAAITMCC